MRVRITHRLPAGEIDGIPLGPFEVGGTYDIDTELDAVPGRLSRRAIRYAAIRP